MPLTQAIGPIDELGIGQVTRNRTKDGSGGKLNKALVNSRR